MDAKGWKTIKINFNSGDQGFQGRGAHISFSGGASEWQQWFEGILESFRPSAVLLFGDQRPIHVTARRVAEQRDVKVVCFEEGYIRPDYITMELGGNNANSSIRDREIDQTNQVAPKPEKAIQSYGFSSMARYATRYFMTMQLDWLQFPYYQHHRQRGIYKEAILWARNTYRKWRWYNFNLRKIQTIIEKHENAYYVVALQVHDDMQLRVHGCGWTVEVMIESVIGSFARHADPAHHLVFKGHPLDRGHGSYRELTRMMAALNRVEERVHYIDDGSLGLLSRHSRGMVTVNSTSAMVSFGHGKPVFALGHSFYERLTCNGSDRSLAGLDRFWSVPPEADIERWRAFRAQMIEHCLVNGSFYVESESPATCGRVIARLEAMLDAKQAN